MSSRKFITAVAVVYLTLIGASADRSLARTLQTQDKFNQSYLFFRYEFQKYGSLFYMFCKRHSMDLCCTLIREEHYADKLPRLSPCDVTLTPEYPNDKIGKEMRILPLSRSKALIFWSETSDTGIAGSTGGHQQVLKFTIVDFSTCRITELKVDTYTKMLYMNHDFLVKSTSFAFYKNSFDIAFHNNACDDSLCKLTINFDIGKIVSDTEYWYYSLGAMAMDIIPKNPDDPDEGHFFFDAESGYIKICRDRSLYSYPYYVYYSQEDWAKFRYSVRDRFITICKTDQKYQLKCDQLDFYGSVKMRTKFQSAFKNLAAVPYTLKGGGFLLLATECMTSCTEGVTYHVSHMHTNGSRSILNEIKDFDCSNRYLHWQEFFEDEHGNPCVSLLCYDSKQKQQTPEYLRVQCFEKSLF